MGMIIGVVGNRGKCLCKFLGCIRIIIVLYTDMRKKMVVHVL